jgi:hypothetical protein
MKKVILLSMILVLGLAQNGFAVPMSGTISGPSNGLYGTHAWSDASLSWEVEETSPGVWQYDYEFIVDAKEISHVIFEVSEDFEACDGTDPDCDPATDNILAGTTTGWIYDDNYSSTNPGNSNPYMPATIPGLKWNFSGLTTINVTLVTDKEPMWGDFYAVDGKKPGEEVYAYSTGFGLSTDAVIGSGNAVDSEGHAWVLVPDTNGGGGGGQDVPEPSTFLLLGFGLAGAGLLRRRIKN